MDIEEVAINDDGFGLDSSLLSLLGNSNNLTEEVEEKLVSDIKKEMIKIQQCQNKISIMKILGMSNKDIFNNRNEK